MSRLTNVNSAERYDIHRSPLAQIPSQRDIASLVRETKDDLNLLATPRYKEQFLVRRTIEANGRIRSLVYPEGRLRGVHERLKFHLSKIIQPSYIMCPRKGRAQRDNALAHSDSVQYLTLDLKQFYPSTSCQMIRNSLISQFCMQADVAGPIAHIATADDRACFGSPLTPVLAAIVHRPMFDAIASRCEADDLSYTVWVDDLTISGEEVSGAFRFDIRAIISRHGLRSHKLKTFTGNRPVFITGVGVVGANLIVPKRIELRSKELWDALGSAQTFDEHDTCSTRLLSHLGGIRAVVGRSTARGQKLANEMNSIRQKREKARQALPNCSTSVGELHSAPPLAEGSEENSNVDSIPF